MNLTSETVQDGYRFARKIQLAMTVFNVSTAGVIFSQKLVCLSGGIVGFYFLLRLILLQPVQSILFFALAFDGIVFYNVMWGNASLIPVMMKELKDQVDVVMAKGMTDNDRQYWKRVAKSIPCIGVSVGGFRSVEWDSTPIFMDFVVRNVVSLLMAFK